MKARRRATGWRVQFWAAGRRHSVTRPTRREAEEAAAELRRQILGEGPPV